MAIEVATAADLNNVRNNLSGDYIQVADISAGSMSPIGEDGSPFTGRYNGNNKSITDLSISGGGAMGLFGVVSGDCMISNVTISGASITTTGLDSAILIGLCDNNTTSNFSVSYCSVTGSVAGTYDCGLLIGHVGHIDSGGIIQRCSAVGNVSSSSPSARIGGFLGSMDSSVNNNIHIKNCYSRATLSLPSNNGWSGGFVGGINNSSNSRLENCYTACTVSGASNTQYLLGFCDSSGIYIPTITNCYYDYTLWPYNVAEEGGSPRSTAAMTYPENFTTTYIDWDFTNIWTHDPTYTINDGYPPFKAIVGFNIWVKKSGVWEPVTDIWVKKGGVWQAVTDVSARKGGIWNPV